MSTQTHIHNVQCMVQTKNVVFNQNHFFADYTTEELHVLQCGIDRQLMYLRKRWFAEPLVQTMAFITFLLLLFSVLHMVNLFVHFAPKGMLFLMTGLSVLAAFCCMPQLDRLQRVYTNDRTHYFQHQEAISLILKQRQYHTWIENIRNH